MLNRNSISINIARQLWSQCGGLCQNPSCNKWLFASIDDDLVSLANVAHIIGHGKNGPRSEHVLAQYINKDGISNLIMLCLDCHKIVDKLERKYNVETIKAWKATHTRKVSDLFVVPSLADEREILKQINDLLEINGTIFREYGPYSSNVTNGRSGDGLLVWRKRCLDTILPNNHKIVQLVEKNKKNFSYPWDLFKEMLAYKMHADAFQDNCFSGQKINDYKTFPREFDFFVKTKLGIPSPNLEHKEDEEIEYRINQIKTFKDRYLQYHDYIDGIYELNCATMIVDLKDGRSLKVFVTSTYYFTEYTLDKIIAIDPSINTVIFSCPAAMYSPSVKEICIESGVGLFHVGKFMGAVRKSGDEYLNYLLKSERTDRLNRIKRMIKDLKPCSGTYIYVFGSYLRREIYKDIDLMFVYSNTSAKKAIASLQSTIQTTLEHENECSHINVKSSTEFSSLELDHNNIAQVFP